MANGLSGKSKLDLPDKIVIRGKRDGDFRLVDRRHPVWQANFSDWVFFHKSYIGGRDYLSDKSNLHAHLFEDSKLYNDRINRVYYYNYCKPVINIFVNFLYSQSVDRKVSFNFWDDWNNNVTFRPDGSTDFQTFIKSCVTMGAVSGMCGALVDMPLNSVDVDGIRSRVIDRNRLPILKLYLAQDICDWSEDSNGLNWIILKEKTRDDLNPFIESKETNIYTLWDRTTWRKYNSDDVLVSEGVHGLGIVPFVRYFNVDVDLDREGESSISDIAHINRSIYNHCSLLDEILYRQAFSQLVVQGDAENYRNKVMSTAGAWNYPDGANKPEFISPDASQAELLMSQIDRSVVEIFRIANLRITGRDLDDTRRRTVAEVMSDFNDTNSALQNRARAAEKFEKQILSIAAKWMGLATENVSEINYPNSFDVGTLMSEIDNAVKIRKLNMGKEYYNRLRSRIAKKNFPGISDDELGTIEGSFDEIPEMLVRESDA